MCMPFKTNEKESGKGSCLLFLGHFAKDQKKRRGGGGRKAVNNCEVRCDADSLGIHALRIMRNNEEITCSLREVSTK